MEFISDNVIDGVHFRWCHWWRRRKSGPNVATSLIWLHLSCVMHRYISKAEKEIALWMSLDSGLSNMEIAKYTSIRPRTMRALLKQYKETGEVVKKPVVSGCPRLLNSLDATEVSFKSRYYMSHPLLQFIEGLVKQQPDILLSEIGEYLRHICHINASSATIMRTLYCQGFTRKKVLSIFHQLLID